MAKVIGLTGGISSGKSTVSGMIREMGYTVIDADIEARLAVEQGQPAYNEIISAFGRDILLDNAEIDRAKLGSIIFNHAEKRKTLNEIVHPKVRIQMNAKKNAAIERGEKLVFLDIPLLFESRLTYMADTILLVYVHEEVQLQRLMNRNGYSRDEAMARMNSQMPLRDKKALADEVIDNNGDLISTKKQLMEIIQRLSK